MALDIDIREDALFQEGKLENRNETALKMLKKGIAAKLISEITDLSAEQIAQIKRQLEAEG